MRCVQGPQSRMCQLGITHLVARPALSHWAAMVLFDIAGKAWPLDDRTAEMLAAAFRLVVAKGLEGQNTTGCAFLADAIESTLVGATSEPIAVDEDAAEALFRQLNIAIKNPDAIEPAYELYLELRRFLGRLYS